MWIKRLTKGIKLAVLAAAVAAGAGGAFPTPALSYSGGSGSADDPWLVSSAADLAELAAEANSAGKYFRQTADISFDDGTYWTPVKNFEGSYDGFGYEIRGLRAASDSEESLGMFARIGTGGFVKNVVLYNAAAYRTSPLSGSGGTLYAGALAGINEGRVESVLVQGTLLVSVEGQGQAGGAAYAGGVVGYNSGTIANVYVSAIPGGKPGTGGDAQAAEPADACITADGRAYAGGIVGANAGKLYDAAVGRQTSISISLGGELLAQAAAGGVAGLLEDGSVTDGVWMEGTLRCGADAPEGASYNAGAVAGESQEGALLYNSVYSAGAVLKMTASTGGGEDGTEAVYEEADIIASAAGSGPGSGETENTEVKKAGSGGAVGFIYTQPRSVSGRDGESTEECKSGATPFPYNGDAAQYEGRSENKETATVEPCPDTTETTEMGQTTIPGFYAPKITFGKAGSTNIIWTFTSSKLVEGTASPDAGSRKYAFEIEAVSDPVYVERIDWDDTEGANWDGDTMAAGETRVLAAAVEPGNVTNAGITWESGDPSVATVTDGVVYGEGPGTVTITAVADGTLSPNTVSISKQITVRAVIKSLTPSDPVKSVSEGDSAVFTVKAEPADVSRKTVDWYIDYTGTGSSYEPWSAPTELSDGESSVTRPVNFSGSSDVILVKAVSGGDSFDGRDYEACEAVFTVNKRAQGNLPSPGEGNLVTGSGGASGGVVPVEEGDGESLFIHGWLEEAYTAGSGGYLPDGVTPSDASPASPDGLTVSAGAVPLETVLSAASAYWGFESDFEAKPAALPSEAAAIYSVEPEGGTAAEGAYAPFEYTLKVPKSSIPQRLYDADSGSFTDTASQPLTLQTILSFLDIFVFVDDGGGVKGVSLNDACSGGLSPEAGFAKYVSVSEDSENYIFKLRFLIFDQAGGRDAEHDGGGKNLWVSTGSAPESAAASPQNYIILQDGAADGTFKVSAAAVCLTDNTGRVSFTVEGVEDEGFEYQFVHGELLENTEYLSGLDGQTVEDVLPGTVRVRIPVLSGLSGAVWKQDSAGGRTAFDGPVDEGAFYTYTAELKPGETLDAIIEYGEKRIESLSFSDFTLEYTSEGGESREIELNIEPSDALSRKVVFVSAAEDIVSVSEEGVATAVSDGGFGTAEIEVTAAPADGGASGNVSYTGKITVVRRPDAVSISGPDTVAVGGQAEYSVSFEPDYSAGEVSWSVENGTGRATVGTGGLLTGIDPGVVTLTAALAGAPDYSASKEITISRPVESLMISPTSAVLKEGETRTFTVLVQPEDAESISVSFKSDAEGVASVVSYDESLAGDNLVVSANGTGTAVITATTAGADASGQKLSGTITIRVTGAGSAAVDSAIIDKLVEYEDAGRLPAGIDTGSAGITDPSKASASVFGEDLPLDLAQSVADEAAAITGAGEGGAAVVRGSSSGAPADMAVFSSPCEDPDAYWLADASVSFTGDEIKEAVGDIPYTLEDDVVVTLMFKDSSGYWNPIPLDGISEEGGEYYKLSVTEDGGIKVEVPVVVFDMEGSVTQEESPNGSKYVMALPLDYTDDGSGALPGGRYLLMDGAQDGEYMFGLVLTVSDGADEPVSPDDPVDPDNPDNPDNPTDGDTDTPDEPAPEPDDGGGSGGCSTGGFAAALLAAAPLLARTKRRR